MDNKEFFVSTLRSTGRKGVDTVIARLEELGFFVSPASATFHLNREGGLLEHSVNVYREALAVRRAQIELRPEVEELLPLESVAVAALLHDVCKADVYRKSVRNRRNAQGEWERSEGYDASYASMPLGHGEKSVIRLLQWGLELTEEEMCAIRWHMGAWDLALQSAESKGCISAANLRTPLLSLIMAADSLSTHVLER